MLLAVLLGVSAPAGPGFAEPADVRVLEDGAPFLAADFENGSPGDWRLESGAPEIITEDGGKVLSPPSDRRFGAAVHALYLSGSADRPGVGLRADQNGGSLARRDLFTLEDESGKKSLRQYIWRAVIFVWRTRWAAITLPLNGIQPASGDTISMVIDFERGVREPCCVVFLSTAHRLKSISSIK